MALNRFERPHPRRRFTPLTRYNIGSINTCAVIEHLPTNSDFYIAAEAGRRPELLKVNYDQRHVSWLTGASAVMWFEGKPGLDPADHLAKEPKIAPKPPFRGSDTAQKTTAIIYKVP